MSTKNFDLRVSSPEVACSGLSAIYALAFAAVHRYWRLAQPRRLAGRALCQGLPAFAMDT